jgi:arylformamidase
MQFLSYELGPDTPTYMSNPRVELQQVSSMDSGGVANWFSLTTINHNGTHVDAPWHFDSQGLRLDELPPEAFVFTSASIVDIPKGPGELITGEELEEHIGEFDVADMLLVRTGFGARYRKRDPTTYGSAGPGFAASAGDVLRRLPRLRCLMMDIISATSPAYLDEGYGFHRAALGSRISGAVNPYVLLVEDCRLDASLRSEDLAVVILAPLRLCPSDGAPCTVLAVSEEELQSVLSSRWQ